MDSFANSVKKPPFVTYPTAALLPPYHGSMGATIYASATAMATTCEVLVHGLEDMQGGAKSGTYEGSHGFPSCPELVDHCNNSDVFVFPPIWDEAFGCTPVEAMAAGIPVVATRSGAIVETIADGETGFRVEKNDSGALPSAILRLLDDDSLRETIGRTGRRRALQHLHLNDIADAMCNRYRALGNELHWNGAE